MSDTPPNNSQKNTSNIPEQSQIPFVSGQNPAPSNMIFMQNPHIQNPQAPHTPHAPFPNNMNQTENENMVFVGGISYRVSEQDLKKCFEIFGPVVSVFIVRDPKHDYASKGYGFITFENLEVAKKVKDQGFIYLKGKVMNIGEAYRGGTRMPFYPMYGGPSGMISTIPPPFNTALPRGY